MSEIKVNKISPRTNCGTTTLGDSGDTFTIPAGATITNNGTAAGFGATGAASWDTTVKTTGFTAVSGVGYFVNTTAGAITVTLPASPSAGAVVAVSDYAGTADTNAITIGRNGSNINGAAADLDIQQENSAVTLVYVDGTQGWKATDTSSLTDIELTPAYVIASGGTETTSGDYKIHTFTGPGTFDVSGAGNVCGSNTVDYLVVAGGGGGGTGCSHGAGGGAGGYRESSGAASGCYTVSPLGACVSALPVTVQGYPIIVGAGGAGAPNPSPKFGSDGINSTFSTITSTGGGAGGGWNNSAGRPGGSGSGSACTGNLSNFGAGNTPSVSPPQGNPGGAASGPRMGGGGGAGESGNTDGQGTGGDGVTSSINATPTTRGGGGAAGGQPGPVDAGAGGGGSGGYESGPGVGGAGTANTGGGGGGSYSSQDGGTGGSGIVIIRYKFQN